jgi:hypothetical protein
MEPPVAYAQDRPTGAATSAACGKRAALQPISARVEAATRTVVFKHDLAPRVSRLFDAYLDADAVFRCEFRRVLASISLRFSAESATGPFHKDDIAAAVAISQHAADIANAIDADNLIEEIDPSFLDDALLADAYATLAFVYLFVVGFYCADPLLGEIGDVAVRFVLLAECELGMVPSGKLDPSAVVPVSSMVRDTRIFEQPDSASGQLRAEILLSDPFCHYNRALNS